MKYEHTPMDLDLWLLDATEGLTMESSNRVRAEITAHYEDAWEAAREAGRSEVEAEREALAALGDPEAAKKKFRAVDLWQGDLDKLTRLEEHRHRTPRESLKKLFVSELITILSFTLVYYIVGGIAWFMLGSFYSPCFDFLRDLRSRFVFSGLPDGTERGFRNAVATYWGAIVLSNYLFLMLTTFINNDPAFTPPLRIGMTLFLTPMAIILWVLFIKRDCDIYITLRRKLKDKADEARPDGPDLYA